MRGSGVGSSTMARTSAPGRGGQAAELRLQLLGGFRAQVGERCVEAAAWQQRKASGLLKVLALAPGHRLHLELLLELGRLHEERGEAAEAIGVLGRVIEAEPAHEGAHVGLMRLYAQRGQRHEALRQYQQLAAALSRELDAKPDAATERL